jgi:hypothetical protein
MDSRGRGAARVEAADGRMVSGGRLPPLGARGMADARRPLSRRAPGDRDLTAPGNAYGGLRTFLSVRRRAKCW